MTGARERILRQVPLTIALECCLGLATIRAQGVTGAAIQGHVLAPDSVAIEDASILVTNTANGERWQTTSRGKGRYGLDQLSVGGPYVVEVHAVGFAPAQRAGIFLSLGQRLTADFALSRAAYQLPEVGVVAGLDPLINPGRTGPAQTISESIMTRLPVPGRDFGQLALLSPQVLCTRPSVLAFGCGGLSIAGQPDRLNGLQIDGATNNDLLGSSLLGSIGTPGQAFGARTLSVEAIKELQVISAPFDVRFGNFAAGLVNAVTKSGGNHFEGSLTSYYSETGLVGKDPDGSRGAEFKSKEVGLTLGGPLVHDRVAFFVDAGIQRRIAPENAALIRPDSPDNVESVGISYASAVRFQEILRDRYGVDAGDFGAFPFRIPAENLLGKVTLQLGVNSRLEVSHNYSHSDLRIVMDRNFDFYPLTSRVFALPVTTHATRLTWTASFGGRYSNELIAARMRERFHCSPASAFPAIYVQAEARQLSAGSACQFPDAADQHILELTDNLTFASGSHRFTLGSHDELIRLSSQQFLDYFFNTGWTFSSLDSLEQGLPYSYTATLRGRARPSGPLSDPTVTQIGTYFQDQWNPTPRLTVTPGLRMDVPFLSRKPVRNVSLLSSPLRLDNVPTPSGHTLWSPRLGLSYDLTGNGSTYLRGGVGLFAGRPAYKWFAEVDAHTGLEAYSLECVGVSSVPPFTIDPTNQPTTCGSGVILASPLVNVFDPAFRFPRNLKLALGADHRLPWGVVGTIDFLYTRAIDQYDLIDLNLKPPAAASGEGNRAMYGTLDSLGAARPDRVTDQFGPVMQVRNARANRAFSLTTQLQKRFPNGTELGVSYTYSRSRDLLSASEDNTDADVGDTPLDGTLDRRRIATAAWEVPHRITLLGTTNLPLGFRMSLFYEGLSGGPYTYTIEGDANADGFSDDDIVYVPAQPRPGGDVTLAARDEEGNLIPASAEPYEKLAAFIDREPCLRNHRGTIMRRNSCRNAWVNNTSARFAKLFPTLHGHRMELSLDVLNLLHLLNSHWGVVRGVEHTRLLRLIGYDPALGRGIYTVQVPRLRVLDVDGSRWRMQLGVRYDF
ncbi:MAG TPA: TonB-dependent receptor [Gemmatimonadales bacterium]|jgi:outer membrane receptor protein involved in Fe transport|nr:TonB-dependent receptor [Gemmatimonadales bacterium]